MPKSRRPSPPAKISRGIATNLGLAGTAAAVIPVVIDFLNDDAIDDRTRRLLIIVAAALAGLVIVARSVQAVAVEVVRGRATPVAMTELHGDVDAGELEPGWGRGVVTGAYALGLVDEDFEKGTDEDDCPTATDGPTNRDDEDGDAVIDHGDPDDHDTIIVAGGGPEDERDLHDDTRGPAELDLEEGPRA
jgi:hypothetical protein